MRVAGFGFRTGADISALRAALAAAQGAHLTALASVKAEDTALQALATEMGLPLIAVPAEALAGIVTITQSPRMLARFGTGSVAEAAALYAAGPGATLLGPRVASPCGRAVAAIAERSRA